MKSIRTLLVIFISLTASSHSICQTLNWASMHDTRHIANVQAGYDHAFTYGLGYGYRLQTKLPIVLTATYTQPAGEDIFDDFKTKLGGVVRVYEINDFHFTAKVQGIFRRFENPYVTMLNFGSDLSATAGYYKPKWFVAGEFGFDKAIVTHFKHTNLFRENFPNVKDGWYQPSTGGNFYFGLQTGYTFGANDITLNAGRVIQQDFETDPTIPFFVKIGYNRRF